MDSFRELGLQWDADEGDIRRAYAALIKQYRPDSYPAEFARVREAYETAMRICRMRHEYAGAENPDSHESRQDEAGECDLQQEQAGQTPARPDVRTVRVVPDAPDSLNPEALVAEKIRELDAQVAAGDEARSLQAFHEQWQAISAFSLDVQMDYVHALREWVIYSGRAPMRLILDAAGRFGWRAQQREVERHYGREGVYRLEMLLELADRYAAAGENRNPHLIIDDSYGRSPPPLIASHYGADWAKMQVRQWRAACDRAEMPELAGRLRFALRRRVQVFWVDVFLALFVAAVTWLTVGPVPGWRGWAVLVLLSPAVLVAPALLRAAGGRLGADSPYRFGVNLARRYRNWRARKLATDGDDAVLTREVTLTLLLGVLFIYGILILVKDSSAIVWFGLLTLSVMVLTGLFIFYRMLSEIEIWLTETVRWLVGLPRQIRSGQYKRTRKLLWSGNVRWWWLALIVISQVARVLSQH